MYWMQTLGTGGGRAASLNVRSTNSVLAHAESSSSMCGVTGEFLSKCDPEGFDKFDAIKAAGWWWYLQLLSASRSDEHNFGRFRTVQRQLTDFEFQTHMWIANTRRESMMTPRSFTSSTIGRLTSFRSKSGLQRVFPIYIKLNFLYDMPNCHSCDRWHTAFSLSCKLLQFSLDLNTVYNYK